jgi:hypothetical protein
MRTIGRCPNSNGIQHSVMAYCQNLFETGNFLRGHAKFKNFCGTRNLFVSVPCHVVVHGLKLLLYNLLNLMMKYLF